MTLASAGLVASHQLAVVDAARRLVRLRRRGSVRSDVVSAELALGVACDALAAVEDDEARRARAEDDTRPMRTGP